MKELRENEIYNKALLRYAAFYKVKPIMKNDTSQ